MKFFSVKLNSESENWKLSRAVSFLANFCEEHLPRHTYFFVYDLFLVKNKEILWNLFFVLF